MNEKDMIPTLQNVEGFHIYFREVVLNGEHLQVVRMTLKPKEEIGMEIHNDTDQLFIVIKGKGKLVTKPYSNSYKFQEKADINVEAKILPGNMFLIKAGTPHNVVNLSSYGALKLVTVYSPPHHQYGTLHVTKRDAEKAHY